VHLRLAAGPFFRSASLGAALVASGALLFLPPAVKRPPAPPVTAAQAWPRAQRGSVPADLPDGTPYEPGLFIDAKDSIGTAPSKDGKTLRFLLRRANGSLRQLRSLPISRDPSFESPTVAGDLVVWGEGTTGHEELWTANLKDGRPPRQLTADTGDARFYESQFDLVIAEGRVHWVAARSDDVTEVRSVAVGGGPVDVRVEQGMWSLSVWPWMVNGVVAAAGTTMMRDVVTGRTITIPSTSKSVTGCSPLWCRVVSLADDGYTKIEMMHPDGSNRRQIADGAAATVIADVGVLDRFEVLSNTTSTSELTGNVQLLVYEIGTRSTIEISPDAGNVSYRNGVLWWSTGSQESFLRHALDLRTV
jgi:hypothetical protein